MVRYDRAAAELALHRLAHEPIALEDADLEMLELVDPPLMVKGFEARKQATLALLPAAAPRAPKTAPPAQRLDPEAIAAVVVRAIASVIEPVRAELADAKRRLQALAQVHTAAPRAVSGDGLLDGIVAASREAFEHSLDAFEVDAADRAALRRNHNRSLVRWRAEAREQLRDAPLTFTDRPAVH